MFHSFLLGVFLILALAAVLLVSFGAPAWLWLFPAAFLALWVTVAPASRRR